MRLIKLDARGVGHHLLLALIVVGVAVGGTYYVLRSNANIFYGEDGRVWQEGVLVDTSTRNKASMYVGKDVNGGSGIISPDGTKIIYQTTRAANGDVKLGYTAPGVQDTSDPAWTKTLLTLPGSDRSGKRYDYNPRMHWSPDSQWVLINRSGPDARYASLVVKADGSAIREVPNVSSAQVRWHKDADTLMFTKVISGAGDAEGTEQLCTITTAGTGEVCDPFKRVDLLAVSNDGKKIAYAEWRAGGGATHVLYVADSDAKNAVKLTNFSQNEQFTGIEFSPSGKFLAFTLSLPEPNGINHGLNMIEIATKKRTQLTDDVNGALVWTHKQDYRGISVATCTVKPSITAMQPSDRVELKGIIKNTTSDTQKLRFDTIASGSPYNGGGQSINSGVEVTIEPNETRAIALGTYNSEAPSSEIRNNTKDGTITFETYAAANYDLGFAGAESCKTAVSIAATKTAMTCTLTAPATVQPGTRYTAQLTIKNTGNVSLSSSNDLSLSGKTQTYHPGTKATVVPTWAGAQPTVPSLINLAPNSTTSLPMQITTSNDPSHTTYTVTLTDGKNRCKTTPAQTKLIGSAVRSMTVNYNEWKAKSRTSVVVENNKQYLQVNGNGKVSAYEGGTAYMDKLTRYVSANHGRKASVCLQARSTSTTKATIRVGMNTGYKNFSYDNKWRVQCFDTTLNANHLAWYVQPTNNVQFRMNTLTMTLK